MLDTVLDEAGQEPVNGEALARRTKEALNRDEEEAILSQYDLGYGYLGNGLTVWNRLE